MPKEHRVCCIFHAHFSRCLLNLIGEAVEERLRLEEQKRLADFKTEVTKEAIAGLESIEPYEHDPSGENFNSRKEAVEHESLCALALDQVADQTTWRFFKEGGYDTLVDACKEAGISNPKQAAEKEIASFVQSENCYKKDILENPGER